MSFELKLLNKPRWYVTLMPHREIERIKLDSVGFIVIRTLRFSLKEQCLKVTLHHLWLRKLLLCLKHLPGLGIMDGTSYGSNLTLRSWFAIWIQVLDGRKFSESSSTSIQSPHCFPLSSLHLPQETQMG